MLAFAMRINTSFVKVIVISGLAGSQNLEGNEDMPKHLPE